VQTDRDAPLPPALRLRPAARARRAGTRACGRRPGEASV